MQILPNTRRVFLAILRLYKYKVTILAVLKQ